MTDPIVFPDSTARFEMPLLHVAQAQKEVFLNEALVRVDTLLHPIVSGVAEEPNEDPDPGECWIVALSATGAFHDQAEKLACWQQGQWTFISPRTGMAVFDKSIGAKRRFNNGWSVPADIPPPSGGTSIDAEARAAINDILDCLRLTGSLPSS